MRRPLQYPCGLVSRAHRLLLPLLFHGPREQGQWRGLGLAAPAPGLYRLLGHELRPGEERLLRLRGLLVVAVAVAVDRQAAVAQDQFDRRPDAVSVVAVPVGPVAIDGLRLYLDDLPVVVHQVLLGAGLGVPGLGEDRLHRLRLVFLVR